MSGLIQTWGVDAPTGVYKNHTLSNRILHTAIPLCAFLDLAPPIDNLGRQRGESITISRYDAAPLPTDGRIGELDDIPENVVGQSTTSVTVSEWGQSIPFTKFNKDLGPDQVDQQLVKALSRQMKLVLDKAIADTAKTTLVKYIPVTAASGTFDTDGTPSTQAGSNLNYYHLERLRDYASATLFMEPKMDGYFRMKASTKAVRGIKLDPLFLQWHESTKSDIKKGARNFAIEEIMIQEVNNQGGASDNRTLRNNLGAAGVLGEAILCGDDALYTAMVEDIGVRIYRTSFDGRRHAIAWYGLLEFGAFWAADSANPGQNNIIHVTSS